MGKLKATRPILYQNRLYEAGEELPRHDPAIVSAWLTAGSAKQVEDTAASKPETAATSGKAKAAGTKRPPAGRGAK